MTVTKTPTPVDVPSNTTTIPLSQIDRGPSAVSVPTATTVVSRSQVDRTPATVPTASDPALAPTTQTVSRPLVTQTTSGNSSANTDTPGIIVEEVTTNTVSVATPLYLTVSDEGTVVLSKTNSIDFEGSGVSVVNTNGTAVVTINAGGNAALGNWAFTGNTQYNLNGGTINNGDLTHGATSSITLPVNGDSNVVSFLNYYGNISLTSGTGPSQTKNWIFDNLGNIVLPTNTSAINYANGTSILSGVVGNYGNSNVVTLLAGFGSNTLSTTGNVTAGYFIGNGSQLTGINASTSSISNGTSNVKIATANSDVTITTAGTQTWSFNSQGDLYFPGNTIAGDNIEATGNFGFETPANVGFGILANAGSQEWAFDTDGKLTAPGEVYGQFYTIRGANGPGTNIGSLGYAGNIVDVYGIEGVRISTIDEGGPFWQFNTTGGLTLPGNAGANNASISSIENGSIVKLNSQANGYVGITGFGSAGNNVAAITAVGLDGETDRVIISVYNPNIDDGEAWTFNNAGDFTTAGGNIFFGTQVDDAVIVPSGIGVKIAADRSDTTTSYVNITSSGITIDALGSSTSDININAGDDVTIRGGNKVANPQQRGGDITLAPGTGGDDGGAGAGNGGYVEIVGGDGGIGINDSAGDGGEVNLVGGYGGTGNITNAIAAGRGGTVVVIGGTGGVNLDDLALNGSGGNVEIYGGQGSIDNANNRPGGTAGHVFLRGGNWGFNFVESGNVHVETYNGNDFLNWKFDNQGRTYFPGLSTARGDTTSGTLSGFTLRIGDGTNEAVITTPDGDANTNSDSQRIVINPGKGADLTSGEGGDIYLWAGRGGSGDGANAVSAGSGGDIKIRGGQGGGVNGDGGYIRMEAGDGATGSEGDSGSAGFIEITGGSSGVGLNGGYVRITAGQGDVVGGDANLVGGYGASGSGGTVNIIGGTSGNGLAEYGNINITSGASVWTFDNTGRLSVPNSGVISTPDATGGAGGYDIGILAGASDPTVWNTNRGGDVNIQGGYGSYNDGSGAPGGNVNLYGGQSPENTSGNVTINTGEITQYTWNFNSNGTLYLPTIATSGETGEHAQVKGTRKIIGEPNTWSTFIDGHSDFGAVAWTASSTLIQSAKITFVVQTNGVAANWEQFDVAICRLDGANAYVSVSGRVKQNSAIDYTDVSGYVSDGSLQVWLNPAVDQTVAYVNYNAVEFNIMPD